MKNLLLIILLLVCSRCIQGQTSIPAGVPTPEHEKVQITREQFNDAAKAFDTVVAQRAEIESLKREVAVTNDTLRLYKELSEVRGRIADSALVETKALRDAVDYKNREIILYRDEVDRLRKKRSSFGGILTRVGIGVTAGLVLRGILK